MKLYIRQTEREKKKDSGGEGNPTWILTHLPGMQNREDKEKPDHGNRRPAAFAISSPGRLSVLFLSSPLPPTVTTDTIPSTCPRHRRLWLPEIVLNRGKTRAELTSFLALGSHSRLWLTCSSIFSHSPCPLTNRSKDSVLLVCSTQHPFFLPR